MRQRVFTRGSGCSVGVAMCGGAALALGVGIVLLAALAGLSGVNPPNIGRGANERE